MNIFEQASKCSLRFNAVMGTLTVEDLWHTQIENLDLLAVSLKKELGKSDTETFLKKEKSDNTLTQLKFDIAKSIIDTRVAEYERAAKAKDIKEKKQKIMAIIASKEDDALKSTDVEDLRKMLADFSEED